MNRRRTLYPILLAAALGVLLPPSLSQARSSAKNGEIAFSARVHGISQVFTVQPNGKGLRQVTHGTAAAGQYGLTWSPSGRSLLYAVTDSDGKDRLVEARGDGTDVTTVSPSCAGTCLGDDAPSYSPDGRKIAFERAFGPIVNDNASRVAICTISTDGSHLSQLTQKTTPATTEDHQPRWSPDGTKIAFERINRSRNKSAIEVMDADGSNVRRLTPFRLEASDPRWSPDGKRILFNTYSEPVQGQSANLFVMRADGSHRVALTHYAGGTLQARADDWSPDGTEVLFRRLAFSGTDTEVGGFFVLNLRNGHIRRLTPVRIRYDALAAWGRQP